MGNHVLRDRIWESRKLRQCSKAAAMAYPWIFLVADDHGRFEFNPRRIWSLVFGNRDDVTLEEVSSWLDEYRRVGLLKRYHIDGDLAVWEGFKGRKASERRDSQYASPDGMPPFIPNNLQEAREESRQGAENRGEPRQIDPRAETEQRQSRAEIPPPAVLAPREIVWSNEAAADWQESKGGPPPGRIFPALKRAVASFGWERVHPVWQYYLAHTGSEFVVVDKFLSGFGEWETRSRGQPAPGGAKQTAGDSTMAAAARVLARHEGRKS